MLLEIVSAASLREHAEALAERIHAFWPQLEVVVHTHKPAKARPRASPFDVVWVERWGGSRTSAIVYTHQTRDAHAPPPTVRELWRELSLKINGQIVV